LGFEILEEREFNEETTKDYVFKQVPDADTELDAKSIITVYVSDGPEIIELEMPSLLGKTEEEAKKMLVDNNLVYKETNYTTDLSKKDGEVISQSIQAGTKVEHMTSVTITVNKLPKTKTGTVNIDISSLYKEPQNNNTNNTNNTNTESNTQTNSQTNTQSNVEQGVMVKVQITSQGTTKNVYNRSHKPSEKNVKVTFDAAGDVTVRVYIDNVLEAEHQINLEEKDVIDVKI
jgi:Uncharacterized protein conserved in bacteria